MSSHLQKAGQGGESEEQALSGHAHAAGPLEEAPTRPTGHQRDEAKRQQASLKTSRKDQHRGEAEPPRCSPYARRGSETSCTAPISAVSVAASSQGKIAGMHEAIEVNPEGEGGAQCSGPERQV